MTANSQPPTYTSAVAGTVLQVARASVIKPILSGLVHMAGALLLLACGGVMAYIGLTEDKLPLLGLSVPFILVGIIFALKAIRHFRAAGDRRIYLQAGPDGVRIGMPSTNKFANTVRLGYRFVVHDMAWTEISNWYPYVMRVNGIPTERSLVFEGQGWKISVPLLFVAGSQKQITADISRAIHRTDLRDMASEDSVQA